MKGGLFGDDPPEPPASAAVPDPGAPLPERMRPRTLDEVAGQDEVLGAGRILRRLVDAGRMPSLLLHGPPGSGKTSLARLLASATGADFVAVSAVTSGVAEIRRAVADARERRARGVRTLLFVDEIHRFHKGQQDALLPHVEDGTLTLVGATTENPSFEVNAALLSRCRLVVLCSLDETALGVLLDRALADSDRGLGKRGLLVDADARRLLLASADGDGRRLLLTLEAAAEAALARSVPGEPAHVDEPLVAEALVRPLRYDSSGDQHYDHASALQKSIRDGDPDASLYWLVRMLESGEDPLFIARRLVVIASEDVGLADPDALARTIAARDAVHFLGRPEGDLALAQAAVYLALAPGSNSVYAALGEARRAVEEHGSLPVPLHLRNAPTAPMRKQGFGKGYRYSHDFEEGITGMMLFPEALGEPEFYVPRGVGFERDLKERLEWFRRRRAEVRESRGSEEQP